MRGTSGEKNKRWLKRRGRTFVSPHGVDDPLLLVASLNEWSEGHYLEPDLRFGMGWLEAVRDSR